MNDCKPVISDAVRRLMEMEDELVYAKDLAPIMKMTTDAIIHHAKNGEWRFCEYVISGNRVKFFRLDFLQKCGFLPKKEPAPPDPEEQTDSDRLNELIELLTVQNMMLNEICTHIRKTASCGNS